VQLSGLKLAGMYMVIKGFATTTNGSGFCVLEKAVVHLGMLFWPFIFSFFRENLPKNSEIFRNYWGFYAINP